MTARAFLALLFACAMGCSLVNDPASHTRGRDAGPVGPDSPIAGPSLRVVHLARDTQRVNVYANDRRIAGGLDFAGASMPGEVPAGVVTFRVTRASDEMTLVEETLTTIPGRTYTLTFYGDEVSPPFGDRTLALLLLEDDASGLTTTQIRLNAVHVASPIRAGQLVAITRGMPNEILADSFGYRASVPLTLAAMAYTIGFDAGNDGILDVEFEVPALAGGTFANVFVAARPDDSVFLLVNTAAGATLEINVPTAPILRVAHLARDTAPVDVFANDVLIQSGLAFRSVGMPSEVTAGDVVFRVMRAGTADMLRQQTLTLESSRSYTLTFYGDEVAPPFPERTLALLLLNDDASGLDTRTSIRLAAVHVASPVIAGQLVAIGTPNTILADVFGFTDVARLTLPSTAYRVGFDAAANGTIDVEFDVPALVPGTYANVFVAARPDNSVFLLVNTSRGGTIEINPRP